MTSLAEVTAQTNDLQKPVSSGGRGFLSTLVKKTAINKVVAPKGHSAQQKDADANKNEPRYQNHADIIQKMSHNTPMSLKDMRLLQDNIKRLDQEAHVEICRMLVESQTDDNAYTVNNYGTYFDIVDLPADLLWRIHYYVNLSLEDLERQKIKLAAQKQWDQDQADNPQYQKMKHQQGQDRSQNIFHQALPTYSIDNLPSYEDLREDALRNLKQSQQPIMSNLIDDENVSDDEYDNPDSSRPGGDFEDENTELGEPSELDDFD